MIITCCKKDDLLICNRDNLEILPACVFYTYNLGYTLIGIIGKITFYVQEFRLSERAFYKFETLRRKEDDMFDTFL